MRFRFCRRASFTALAVSTLTTVTLLAGCASQESSVELVPPPPDLQPAPIRATSTSNWAMATPAVAMPRAVAARDNDVMPTMRSLDHNLAAVPANANRSTPPLVVANSATAVKKPAAVQQPMNMTTASNDLRVMTFNLRVKTFIDGLNMWDHRRALVVSRVREFDPDLLGTQEGLNVMETYLQEKLADYTFFGVGRDNGKTGGEMCGVFFRSTRFDMIDGGHFWLSHNPEKPGSKAFGAFFPRMVTWVKLREKSNGQTFCWFNTHFEAWNGHARKEEAKVMLTEVDQIAGTMPTVITGDFNSDQGSAPYQTMLAPRVAGETPFVDTFRVANPDRIPSEEGTMHGFSGKHDGQRIDWILASEADFQVVNCEIDRTRGTLGYPSDHFPVTATLRLAPTSMPLARIE